MKKLSVVCLGLCLLLSGWAANAAVPYKGYQLLAKISVPGDGGWDALAVDPAAGRLYVSHSTKVDIIDVSSNTVVGQVPGLAGVHAIAIAPDLGRGFISDGKAGRVIIFDLKTLAKLGSAETGQNPDAILYDPATRNVFAFNGKSNDATVIGAASGRVLKTIKLDGKPEFAAADGRGHVYVNLEDKNSVAVIDAGKLAVANNWPLAPGEGPTGLALDAKRQRLFIGCGNKLMIVMNSETGQVIASRPVGDRVDGTAFDPELGLALSSNGDGSLTVVGRKAKDKYAVLENVPTQSGARTIALDPLSHRVFLPVADFGPAPAPTAQRPHPRPAILPGTFRVLVFSPK